MTAEVGLNVETSGVRRFLDAANIGIVICDRAGQMVEVNPWFCDMLGYERAEVLGLTFLELTHPDDIDPSVERVKAALEGAVSTVRLTKRYLRKDGSVVWANVVVWAVRSPTGDATYTMAAIEDITARHVPAGRLEDADLLKNAAADLALIGGWSMDVRDRDRPGSVRYVLGRRSGALSLTDLLDRIPPEHRVGVADAIEDSLARGSSFDVEFPVRSGDGRLIMLRAIGEARRGEAGEVLTLLGAFQDVTERRGLDDEVRDLAARLSMTVESISDGLIMLNRDWVVTDVNGRAEQILSVDRETLVGRVLWDLFPIRESVVGAAYERAMRGTIERVPEYYYAQKDMWVEVRAFPSAMGISVLFQDISEQRVDRMRAVERTRLLAEQAALLDATGDAIVVRDMVGQVTFWNRSAETVLGRPSAEAIGHDIRGLLQLNGEQVLLDAAEWNGEVSVVAPSGETRILDCRQSILANERGETAGILTVFTDITDRKRDELHSQRIQRMESVGTMTAGLAHDLNNALMPAMLAAGRLQDLETDEERSSLVSSIAAGVDRAAALVRKVVEFVAPANQDRIAVDIAVLLRHVEQFVNDTFLKTIEVACNVDPALPLVQADATQLQQVLLNLCANARDAMPSGGTLTLSAAVADGTVPPGGTGDFVRLTVGDTGPGIDSTVLERMFEPFFTTKAIDRHTGLGLPTAAAIVREHGGYITVESSPGNGTAVHVHLPVGAEPAPAAPSPEEQPLGTPVILVVDDEELIRRVLRSVLESASFEVIEATSGALAVEALRNSTRLPDAAIIDMMMPGLDGLQTATALREIQPDLPVAMMTGLPTAFLTKKAREAGVGTIVAKPFEVDVLLTIVRSLLTPEG